MVTNEFQAGASGRWGILPAIFKEALLVALAGLVFALLANQLSPRGLSLTRNYFPAIAGGSPSTMREQTVAATNQSPAEALAVQIKASGLKLASGGQVIAWLADPRHQTQQIIFVDARNEEEFLQGHLPGAWLFDPYQPEKYFPAVLPSCQAAEQIIVYCHGGDCDDSLSAANLLKDAGIPAAKLWIYGGGMSEWETNGQPLEIGPQNSGQFKKGGS
jgi:rhodanese-related sulfurtransferase